MANYKIKCCKGCVAPKRHVGCHDTCKDYIKEKQENEAQNKWEKENATYVLKPYDFDEIAYSASKRHKKKQMRK